MYSIHSSSVAFALVCLRMILGACTCPHTGLLARRAKIVERAWVHVARDAVGFDEQVIPQQWLVHATAPGVPADDRRRLDLLFYAAPPRGTRGAAMTPSSPHSRGRGTHSRGPLT